MRGRRVTPAVAVKLVRVTEFSRAEGPLSGGSRFDPAQLQQHQGRLVRKPTHHSFALWRDYGVMP